MDQRLSLSRAAAASRNSSDDHPLSPPTARTSSCVSCLRPVMATLVMRKPTAAAVPSARLKTTTMVTRGITVSVELDGACRRVVSPSAANRWDANPTGGFPGPPARSMSAFRAQQTSAQDLAVTLVHLACTLLVAARPSAGRRLHQRPVRGPDVRLCARLTTGSCSVSLAGSAIQGRDPAPGRLTRPGVRKDSWRASAEAARPGEELNRRSCSLHGVGVGQEGSRRSSSGGHHPAHRALGQAGRRGRHPRSPVPWRHHRAELLQLKPQRVAGAHRRVSSA